MPDIPSGKSLEDALAESLKIYQGQIDANNEQYKNDPAKAAALNAQWFKRMDEARSFWSNPTGQGQYRGGINVPLFYTNKVGDRVYYEPDPAKRRAETIWDRPQVSHNVFDPNFGKVPTAENPLYTGSVPKPQPIQIPPAIAASVKPPVNTSPLLQAIQNQSAAAANPLVKPPTQSQGVDVGMFAPISGPKVQMPDFVKKKPEFGKNWGDLFSAVQSRYTT